MANKVESRESDGADWYYSSGTVPEGPCSIFDVEKQVEKNPDMLVWTSGMENWTAAKQLAVFRAVLKNSPPPLPSYNSKAETVSRREWPAPIIKQADIVDQKPLNIPYDGKVHPYRRFLARFTDIYLVSILCTLIFPHLNQDGLGQNLNHSREYAMYMAVVLVCIPFETVLLYLFGATPGKFIYNIAVSGEQGKHVFWRCLRRSISVWWRGLGLGLPLISLFANAGSLRRLKTEGHTTWDRDFKFSVIVKPMGIWRTSVVAVLITIGALSTAFDLAPDLFQNLRGG